jgi:hypothetical protein
MATTEDITALVEKMTEERDKLLEQFEALSEANAASAPSDAEGEAQWSPKQQACHLAEMETAYRAWVQRALVAENPDVTTVRGEQVVIPLEKAHEYVVDDLVEQLRAQRIKTLAMIEGLKPADYDRTASQPMFGTLTVLQWLRSYYRHDRMHQAQLAGRESSFKPNFVTGSEPDQRQVRLQ